MMNEPLHSKVIPRGKTGTHSAASPGFPAAVRTASSPARSSGPAKPRPGTNRWSKLELPRFAGRNGAGPFVVALEGPNGAGKSTLCAALARQLNAPACLGTDPAWFAEPFKTRMIRDADWHASAMFFLSGCFEQMRLLHQKPEPMVLLDRSLWSTLAVHAATDPARLSILLAVLKPLACEIRVPELTVVLEASFETCRRRSGLKQGQARELDDLTATPAFHKREREFYHWLARSGGQVEFVDANRGSAESVAERALGVIRSKLRC